MTYKMYTQEWIDHLANQKTLARALYLRMELNEQYTTRDLISMIDFDEIWDKFLPELNTITDLHEKYLLQKKAVTKALWSIVNTRYASTTVQNETYHMVRGLKYDAPNRDWSKVPTNTYTTRRWWRTK